MARLAVAILAQSSAHNAVSLRAGAVAVVRAFEATNMGDFLWRNLADVEDDVDPAPPTLDAVVRLIGDDAEATNAETPDAGNDGPAGATRPITPEECRAIRRLLHRFLWAGAAVATAEAMLGTHGSFRGIARRVAQLLPRECSRLFAAPQADDNATPIDSVAASVPSSPAAAATNTTASACVLQRIRVESQPDEAAPQDADTADASLGAAADALVPSRHRGTAVAAAVVWFLRQVASAQRYAMQLTVRLPRGIEPPEAFLRAAVVNVAQALAIFPATAAPTHHEGHRVLLAAAILGGDCAGAFFGESRASATAVQDAHCTVVRVTSGIGADEVAEAMVATAHAVVVAACVDIGVCEAPVPRWALLQGGPSAALCAALLAARHVLRVLSAATASAPVVLPREPESHPPQANYAALAARLGGLAADVVNAGRGADTLPPDERLLADKPAAAAALTASGFPYAGWLLSGADHSPTTPRAAREAGAQGRHWLRAPLHAPGDATATAEPRDAADAGTRTSAATVGDKRPRPAQGEGGRPHTPASV